MNLFIIGAGFTKSVFPTAPLNCGLLDALAHRSTDSFPHLLRERYKTDDIEIALTRLDADIATSQGGTETSSTDSLFLRRRIEAGLADYFTSFVASDALIDRAPWLAQMVDHAFSPGDVPISLNYDCVLEGVLDCRGKWSPRGGYGYPFNQSLICDADYPISPVEVLKIHGSANFVIAPYGDKPESNAVNFVVNENFFPHSGKSIHFEYGAGTGRRYLIAPSYVKVPTVEIAYLMLDAVKASESARKLVLIGTSLRPEDGFLTVMLTHFLRQKSWRDRRVIIVDPDANAIANRLRTFWGVNISTQIVPIQGLLEASVPLLLGAISARNSS